MPQINELKKSFYFFSLEVKSKKSYIYMALILFGIASLCLFPVWPMSFKKFIFYLSVVILFVLVKTNLFIFSSNIYEIEF